MSRIGFVTIGQAPRNDVVDSMVDASLSSHALQTGALDGLDSNAIAALRPQTADHPLVTRLTDGREVVVGKTALLPALQRAIDRAAEQGANPIVVLCTGEFPQLTAPVPLIYPDRLLAGAVNALQPAGRLGVLMPHPDQATMMERKWFIPGRELVLATASPYTGAAELAQRGRVLAQRGAELIVLDCMGYTRAMKETVVQATGIPTILANRLVGRIIEELAAV